MPSRTCGHWPLGSRRRVYDPLILVTMDDMSQPTVSEPDSTKGVGQAYALLILVLLLVVIVGAAAQLAAPMPGLALTEIVLIFLPTVAYVRFKGLSVVEGLQWKAVPWPIALTSALLGCSSYGVAILIYFLLT